MQGARHGFINGKNSTLKAAEKHSVECIVLLTLVYYILSCLGRCNKRPSRNILLTGLLFTQSGCTYKFCSPAGLALTHSVHSVCVCMCAAP